MAGFGDYLLPNHPGAGDFFTNLGLALAAAGQGGQPVGTSRFGMAAPYLSQAIQAPRQAQLAQMQQQLIAQNLQHQRAMNPLQIQQAQKSLLPKEPEAPSGYAWQGGSLSAIPGGPADPKTIAQNRAQTPRTVNTADGVFLLNDDGTLGSRLGGPASLVTINQPPSGYRETKEGKFEPVPGGPADPATITEREKAVAAGKPEGSRAVSAESAKVIGLVDSGIKGLSELENVIFDKKGNLNSRAVLLSTLPWQGLDEDAKKIATYAYMAADAELRLKTGAQAPQSEIERQAKALLPNVTDNAETARTKLGVLKSYLEGVDKPLRPEKYQTSNAEPSQADLEFTAKKHGISVDEVKKRLKAR